MKGQFGKGRVRGCPGGTCTQRLTCAHFRAVETIDPPLTPVASGALRCREYLRIDRHPGPFHPWLGGSASLPPVAASAARFDPMAPSYRAKRLPRMLDDYS